MTRLWLWPAVAASLSLLTLGVLLWSAHLHDLNEHAQDFHSDIDSAFRSLNFRVQGTEEYLHLLASEAARGALDAADFGGEVAEYVRDNPELVQITLTDAELEVLGTASDRETPPIPAPNLAVPETAQAVGRAMQSRQPTYTELFEPVAGHSVVELYVPILHDDAFVGMISGVYSCNEILRQAVPKHVSDSNRVSLVNANGSVACSLDAGAEDRPGAGPRRAVRVLRGRGRAAVRALRGRTVPGPDVVADRPLRRHSPWAWRTGMFALARYAVERQRGPGGRAARARQPRQRPRGDGRRRGRRLRPARGPVRQPRAGEGLRAVPRPQVLRVLPRSQTSHARGA